MSTSSCHPNHPCYPLVLPLMYPSQFQLLDIPWVPVFLRLPVAFQINFRFLSQTSNSHCQLISKHPIAVQAWITFVLDIALKMQLSAFFHAAHALFISLWRSASHLKVTLSSVPTIHFILSFDTCHILSIVHLLRCPLTQIDCELRAAGTELAMTVASHAC